MTGKKHTHVSVLKYICDNLDRNIDSPHCREIRKHIENCPGCSFDLASLKKTIQLYRTYPTPRVPAAAQQRLKKILKDVKAGGKKG